MKTPEQTPECKLFLCAEHGFYYMALEEDDKNTKCPRCGEIMSFEGTMP